MKLQKILLFIGGLIFSNVALSQNYIYFGNVRYESTQEWGFNLKKEYWTNNSLDLSIGKTKTGGCLLVSIETPFNQDYIGGMLTLYLSDGSIIQCIDRKKNSRLNDKSYNLYNLTASEIDRLKEFNIVSIIFGIIHSHIGVDHYEATNEYYQDSYGRKFNKIPGYFVTDVSHEYNTNEEIIELFK